MILSVDMREYISGQYALAAAEAGISSGTRRESCVDECFRLYKLACSMYGFDFADSLKKKSR